MDSTTYDLLVNDKFIREHFVVITFEDDEPEDDGRLFLRTHQLVKALSPPWGVFYIRLLILTSIRFLSYKVLHERA